VYKSSIIKRGNENSLSVHLITAAELWIYSEGVAGRGSGSLKCQFLDVCGDEF
jgi:hypothetical protein